MKKVLIVILSAVILIGLGFLIYNFKFAKKPLKVPFIQKEAKQEVQKIHRVKGESDGQIPYAPIDENKIVSKVIGSNAKRIIIKSSLVSN